VTDINRPLLGEPNAPCRTCGSPLAADQRYCLQCGARRAEARLPFLDILARQAGAAPVGATTTVTTTRDRRVPQWLGGLGTNAAAVAGVACLVLALGVGVLIGSLGGGTDAGAVPAQNITVSGSGAPAAAAPTSAAPATTAVPTDTGSAAPSKTAKKQATSAKNTASSSSSGSKATNKALKALDSTKGGDYAKKSKRLPKTLGTGGKAPPIDKGGTVGAGSAVQSIG
jgi:hypothetical protein